MVEHLVQVGRDSCQGNRSVRQELAVAVAASVPREHAVSSGKPARDRHPVAVRATEAVYQRDGRIAVAEHAHGNGLTVVGIEVLQVAVVRRAMARAGARCAVRSKPATPAMRRRGSSEEPGSMAAAIVRRVAPCSWSSPLRWWKRPREACRLRGCRERTNTSIAQCWSVPISWTSLGTLKQREGHGLGDFSLLFSSTCDVAVLREESGSEAGTARAIESFEQTLKSKSPSHSPSTELLK